jgi:hypothetical protein
MVDERIHTIQDRLPRAPPRYSEADQRELRRVLELQWIKVPTGQGELGGLSVILEGLSLTGLEKKTYVEFPFAARIDAVRLFADASGSVVVDIWKDSYANFPPTVADTITAAAKPTLGGTDKYQDLVMTGWVRAIAAGDVLAFGVDSVASVARLTIALTFVRT